MRELVSLALLVTMLWSSQGWAQAQADVEDADALMALSLEALLNVVVTASKTEQRVEDSPASVDIINAEDIRRRGYQTVAEVIKDIPGMASIDDLVNLNVGVRGLYSAIESASDIIKVMVNSQRTDFRPTGENAFGYDLIPIQAVKRIEIVRGPASVLYGANAYLGVINIITFEGDELLPEGQHSETIVEARPVFATKTGRLNAGGSAVSRGTVGKLSYVAGAAMNYADRSGLEVPGADDIRVSILHAADPANNPLPLGYPSPTETEIDRSAALRESPSRNDTERALSAYAQGSYALTDTQRLRLDGRLSYFDRGVEFGAIRLTHRSRASLFNGHVRVQYELSPAGARGVFLNASAALSGGSPTDSEKLADTFFAGYHVRRHMSSTAIDLLAEGGYAFSEKDRLSIGVEYNHDIENLLALEFITDAGESQKQQGMGTQLFANTGVYGQVLWSPFSFLNVAAGARLDHNSTIACDSTRWDCLGGLPDTEVTSSVSDDRVTITDRGFAQLSTRAAVVYTAPFAGLYAKAMYGTSFKPPSPFQLYHSPVYAQGTQGFPYLKPQTAATAEVQVGHSSRTVKATASLFYTSARGLILFFDERALKQPRNGNAEVTGLEAQAAYTWNTRLRTQLNATYILSNVTTTEKRVGESDLFWKNSPLNVALTKAMFPNLSVNALVHVDVPEAHLSVNVRAHFVGTRFASQLNAQVFDGLHMNRSYAFPAYLNFDVTVSSQGIHLFKEHETVFTLGAHDLSGPRDDPGNFLVDIPTLGPRVFLSVLQEF